MTHYKVTLIDRQQNFSQTIDVPETETILNEAAENNIKISFECVVGSCGICQAELLQGSVDQTEQIFLSDRQAAQGNVLLCVAKPTSDCTLAVILDHYL